MKDYETYMADAGADVGPEPQTDREMLMYLMDAFDSQQWVCDFCTYEESTARMDSALVLREYLAAHPAQETV